MVIRAFIKNAHNYSRNYGLDAHTLGQEVTKWWAEICSPGASLGVQFGGPTGIYILVVLMSWWCLLLETEPIGARADCLRMLEDVDRALQTAINNLKLKKQSRATTMLFSPSTPPPSSQPRKRMNAEEAPPHPKRLRS